MGRFLNFSSFTKKCWGFPFKAVKILPETVSSLICDSQSLEAREVVGCSFENGLLGPVPEGSLASQTGAELAGNATLLTFLSKDYLEASWLLH